MKRKYGPQVWERYVQSYNIPQPIKKQKRIQKTKTKSTKSGTKTIPIDKMKTYWTKPKPAKPIKPINAPQGTTRDGVIYGDPGLDVVALPVIIDGQGVEQSSDDAIEYGHDLGAGGGRDVGE